MHSFDSSKLPRGGGHQLAPLLFKDAEWRDEDSVEDLDYEPADFAMRRIKKDIEMADESSTIAFNTRSRVRQREGFGFLEQLAIAQLCRGHEEGEEPSEEEEDDGDEADDEENEDENDGDSEYRKFLLSLQQPMESALISSSDDEDIDERALVAESVKIKQETEALTSSTLQTDVSSLPPPRKRRRTVNAEVERVKRLAAALTKSQPKCVAARYPLAFGPTTVLSQSQHAQISAQLQIAFQLAVILRHATLDRTELAVANTIATDALETLQTLRKSARNSLQLSTRKKSRKLRYFGQMSERIVVSVFEVQGLDEYLALNRTVLRTLNDNLRALQSDFFSEAWMPTTVLSSLLMSNVFKKPYKYRSFSKMETVLLRNGLNEVSTLDPSSRRFVVNDWSHLHRRFLPHRNLVAIQNKVSRVRSGALLHQFKRIQPSEQLTDEQMAALVSGVRLFGESNWTQIQRRFPYELGQFSPRVLRKYWRTSGVALQTEIAQNCLSKCTTAFFKPGFDGCQDSRETTASEGVKEPSQSCDEMQDTALDAIVSALSESQKKEFLNSLFLE